MLNPEGRRALEGQSARLEKETSQLWSQSWPSPSTDQAAQVMCFETPQCLCHRDRNSPPSGVKYGAGAHWVIGYLQCWREFPLVLTITFSPFFKMLMLSSKSMSVTVLGRRKSLAASGREQRRAGSRGYPKGSISGVRGHIRGGPRKADTVQVSAHC